MEFICNPYVQLFDVMILGWIFVYWYEEGAQDA